MSKRRKIIEVTHVINTIVSMHESSIRDLIITRQKLLSMLTDNKTKLVDIAKLYDYVISKKPYTFNLPEKKRPIY